MNSSIDITAVVAPRVISVAVPSSITPAHGPAEAGESRAQSHLSVAAEAPQRLLIRPDLTIELDAAAQHFVQTLIDPASASLLRRYPAENQLAFSRGVHAFTIAMWGALEARRLS